MLKKRIAALVAVATVALITIMALGPTTSSSAPIGPGENAIVHWSGVAEGPISAGRAPASSAVMAGILHAAMYDAVAATTQGLRPFATKVTAPPGASADAAVGQAARDVLLARLPAQTTTINDAYNAFMAGIPDGPAKEGGKAVGAAAAAGTLAMRFGDGWADVEPYNQPTPGLGVFEPIAPTKPVGTELPTTRPFTYESLDEYRPDAPYDGFTSRRYARDVNEVQRLGGNGTTTPTERSAEQTETVLFHTDQTYAQFSRGIRKLAYDRDLGLRESAQLLGYTWVAVGDTMLACWEAKYHHMLWRPNHAIQRANTDGNPLTTADPNWLPRVTGNHPEYPSGHGCFTSGVTTSLRQYFGTKRVELTLDSTVTGAGQPRTYERLDELVDEVKDARVWGGLHYRTTMDETFKHFPEIARDVADEHFFGRDRDHDDDD